MIRSIFTYFLAIIHFGFLILFFYPLVLLLGEEKGAKFTRKLAIHWGKFLCKITFTKVEVIYKDREIFDKIKDEIVVVVGNHQSLMDIPILFAYFPKEIGFVAKEELKRIFFLSLWMKRAKCVFIDRKSPKKAYTSFKKAIEYIQNGYSLVIFPEGTRTEEGEIKEFKKGSFKLALESKKMIIPVTIKGSYEIHKKHRFKLGFNKRVKLIIDTPIETINLSQEEKKNLKDIVRKNIIYNYNTN
jgi:1-acyl-sn-glycerol-3-phosphate acyltransferase